MSGTNKGKRRRFTDYPSTDLRQLVQAFLDKVVAALDDPKILIRWNDARDTATIIVEDVLPDGLMLLVSIKIPGQGDARSLAAGLKPSEGTACCDVITRDITIWGLILPKEQKLYQVIVAQRPEIDLRTAW